MRWPGSTRSHRLYPLPPALQLKEWLTIIDDSTRHLSRYYSDSELPTGILSARDANGDNDVQTIRDELEAAKGDPRSAPVIDTDARWIEVGGSAVDLSHIEEQQWFLQLCMAAFGVPKTELGMDDQVNYSTSESELQVIAKRITSKIAPTIATAIERQLLPQFDLFQSLDQPFGVDLRYTDPREERAEEERARQQYKDGVITYREYRERQGDDMSDVDTTVMLNGQEIDYGAYPKHVVGAMLADARTDESAPSPSEEMSQ
jgi:phage portal protein BeeE